MNIETLIAAVDDYCDAACDAGIGTNKIGFAEGIIAKAKKDHLRKLLEDALRQQQGQREPIGYVIECNGLRGVHWDVAVADLPAGTKFFTSSPAPAPSQEYPRAQYFQAGFVGNGAEYPQIVHYAGDDVTVVATFRRSEDRDYFLSLLADRAIRPAAGMVSVPVEITGKQWSAGRNVFQQQVDAVEDAKEGYELRSAIIDRAPEKIYAAMIAAASQENSK